MMHTIKSGLVSVEVELDEKSENAMKAILKSMSALVPTPLVEVMETMFLTGYKMGGDYERLKPKE